MVTEDDLTLCGGHRMQYTECILQKCTLETYVILLSNATPINLNKKSHGSLIKCIFWCQNSKDFDGVGLSKGPIIMFLQRPGGSDTQGPCTLLVEKNKIGS